jgi:hypothetical protein
MILEQNKMKDFWRTDRTKTVKLNRENLMNGVGIKKMKTVDLGLVKKSRK